MAREATCPDHTDHTDVTITESAQRRTNHTFRARNVRGSVMPAAPYEGLIDLTLTLLLLRALPSTPSDTVLESGQ